jgi:hypothetical protein
VRTVATAATIGRTTTIKQTTRATDPHSTPTSPAPES